MVVAMCMASPRTFCRSAARESIESLPPNTDSMGSLVSEGLVWPCKFVRIALAVATVREVGEWESISVRLGLLGRKGVRWDRVFNRWNPWGPGRRYDRVGRWNEEGK